MEPDAEPAAEHLADLISQVCDDVLDSPTPCSGYRLGNLLAHVGLVAVNYTVAARRPPDPVASPGFVQMVSAGAGGVPRLADGWRVRIPRDLRALAAAWRQPSAWTGTAVRADGCQLEGAYAGLIVFDELVLHGWDVARSIGRPYAADADAVQMAHRFQKTFQQPGRESWRDGIFDPPVVVPDSAPFLERVLGLSGRDPAWRPRGIAAGTGP